MSYRAGFVGLIGLPNAGKSTLANALVGEKISIVTAKPQTTRQRVLGILNDEQSQILFVDAPGRVKSTSGLNQFLSAEYAAVIADSDVLVAVLNLDQRKPEELLSVAQSCADSGKPWMAVISKTDFPEPQRVAILRGKLSEFGVPVVGVSALHQPAEARELILPLVRGLLPESEAPLYDTDAYTTQSMREMAAETVREKCFEHLHQEIPYGLAVKTQKYVEDEGKIVKIYADILVNKEGHKAIVVGKGGSALKRIGTLARQDLERVLGRKVYLELHVVVRKNWATNPQMLEELGYVVPQ
jgi:GTP-binding protein Era